MKNFYYFFILVLSVQSQILFAQLSPKTQKQENTIKAMTYSDYMTVSNSTTGESFSGLGVGVELSKALTEKWAFGGGVRQTFGMGGSGGTITSLSVRATKAITGKLKSSSQNTELGNQEVIQIKERDRPGWRAQIMISQYFFNTSISSIPYTGLGLSFYREWPRNQYFNWVAGGRIDHISNSDTLNPISLFGGITFYL